MNHPARLMTADEFLDWRQAQPGRWELVSGHPVQAMAGAKQRHDLVTVNLIMHLGTALRGTACRPWSADIAVAIPGGNVRQPDVTIDCAPVRPDGLISDGPTVVFEVLSPATRAFDQTRKLEDYRRVGTLRHIVFIDLVAPRVAHWFRADSGEWALETLEGLTANLTLPAAGVSLTLAQMYDGVEFTG